MLDIMSNSIIHENNTNRISENVRTNDRYRR